MLSRGGFFMQEINKSKKLVKIILLVLVVSTFLLSACGTKINRENYEKITTGMTLGEVVNILGDDYEESAGASFLGMSGSYYIWDSNGKSITIICVNEIVVFKTESGL